jgi:hypothetical protein
VAIGSREDVLLQDDRDAAAETGACHAFVEGGARIIVWWHGMATNMLGTTF